MISVKKSRGFTIFTMVLMLVFVSGCAKKTVLKEDSVPKESVAVASKPVVQAPEKSTLKPDVPVKAESEKKLEAMEKEKKEKEALAKKTTAKAAEKPTANFRQEIFELTDINFDFDKYNLRDEARAFLDKDSVWMTKDKDVKVVIEGHCDERGTAEYNMALGQRRADAAAKYLTDMGIDAKRIKTVSYGFERPLDTRHNEEAWAKNRRGHFVVSGK